MGSDILPVSAMRLPKQQLVAVHGPAERPLSARVGKLMVGRMGWGGMRKFLGRKGAGVGCVEGEKEQWKWLCCYPIPVPDLDLPP